MSAPGYTGHMVKHDHELYPDWGKRYELFNYQPSSNMAEQHSTAKLLNSIPVIISMLDQTSCMVYFYVF